VSLEVLLIPCFNGQITVGARIGNRLISVAYPAA
jgi:hypothetical protein